jgi:predicted Zn-dependent peptidase
VICKTYTTQAGLRIIHAEVDSPVSYCGFAVNAGSRNEAPALYGLAHFVEHGLFKGTKKRKVWHILNRMETVGGELNAYTSKEETLIYAISLEKDFERAFELLCDLAFHSQFPEKELTKEKEVVLDEINSYEDNPSELIFDEFENCLFNGHPLGHSILGVPDTVKQFSVSNVTAFVRQHYTPTNMVFFYMGKTGLKKIIRLADKYIPPIAVPSAAVVQTPIMQRTDIQHTDQYIRLKKDTHQAHVIIGNYACHLHHPDRMTMSLLNNMLGGPGMNSRLNIALRERSGLVYSVESNLTSFSDTGVFMIYFGTDRQNIEKCQRLIRKELNSFCTKKLTPTQLLTAQRQLTGQISISHEQRENVAMSLGKSILRFNRYDTLPEICKKIEQISAADILRVANEVLDETKMLSLIYE